ncbi:MAG: hypothetical protein K2X43_14145 [Hyphomonadaceae bacterium]|jgi:hypothetical protein|nr:hypothetical protein [Hyphomonadaceae bacterium]
MLPDLPQTEAAVVEMTNALRKAQGLEAVKPNAHLAAAARAFAAFLARTGKFAHDADGRNAEDRAQAQGYRHCLVAENLAWTSDSRGFASRQLAQDMVEGWKTSPGHRANLLLAGATEIGVAVVRVPDIAPKFLAVQMLGRPQSLKVTFSIQNQSGATVRYTLGAEAEMIQPRETVTHTDCEPRMLSIDGTSQGPVRHTPRDGDRLIIRADTGRGVAVDIERK